MCSCAHFHGEHMYRSNNIPGIFPRRDLKTGEILWPVDIPYLLVKETSEENHRNDTVTVHVPKVAQCLSRSKSSIEASNKTQRAEESQESLDEQISTVSAKLQGKKQFSVVKRIFMIKRTHKLESK